MVKIASLQAREILDSRGFPTVEVDCRLADGSFGRASVPSGKSTGSQEAQEMRDHDTTRFGGQGVLTAVHNIQNEVFPAVRDMEVADQETFDRILIDLDGTAQKQRLGANVILGCSLAFARAQGAASHQSLARYLAGLYGHQEWVFPVPMMNVINGGKHADSGISTQEFMLVPHGADDIAGAIRMGAEIYHVLQDLLKAKGYRVSVGDEGGFAPQLRSSAEALELLTAAMEKAGYAPGEDVSIALDFAANDFYRDGVYRFEGHAWTAEEMTDYCLEISRRFPIVSIEDGLAEGDWEGWVGHSQRLSAAGLQCVGDDIFVTNPGIFQKGIDQGIANAILIKLNQIGTLSETLATMRLAAQSHYRTVVSHRSGETDDPFIADFALATSARQMKSGAPARGERVAKYNQLLRLTEDFPTAPLAKGLYGPFP